MGSILAATWSFAAQAQPLPAEPPKDKDAAGEWTLDAGVAVLGIADDNVFADRNDRTGDVAAALQPFADVRYAYGSDAISFGFEADLTRYLDHKAQDYDDWQVDVSARKSLLRGFTLLAGAELKNGHEGAESPDAEDGYDRIGYSRKSAHLGLLIDRGRISARLAGTVMALDYRDPAGGLANNDDRDRWQGEIGTRIGWRPKQGLGLFVQAAADRRDYDSAFDDFGYRRESRGFSAAAGLTTAPGKPVSGEIYAGWMRRDYHDPLLDDVATFDIGALVEWNGAHGVSASARLDRDIYETTLPGSSASIGTSGRIEVEGAASQRLSAGLGVTGAHYDYVGSSRRELVLGAELWTRYRLRPHTYLQLRFRHEERTSNDAGFDYVRNRVEAGIGTQLRPAFDADAPALRLITPAPGGAYLAVLGGYGTLVGGLDGVRGGTGSNIADFGGAGSSAAIVGGYGAMAGPLYLGLEGEASLDGGSWSHDGGRVFSIRTQLGLGLSARLGVAALSTSLAYARFGVDLARMDVRYDYEDVIYRRHVDRLGLGGGLGLEAAAGGRGFVRAEYVVTSYGDIDVPAGGGNFDNFSLFESRFRLGAGLRFGASSAPPGPETAMPRFAGAYIGLAIGHGALISANRGIRSGETELSVSRASHSATGGVLAGYGGTLGRLYLGVEAQAQASAIDWNIERSPGGRIYSARADLAYGAALRAGAVLGHKALLYAQVGVVRTLFDIPYATSGTEVRDRRWRTGLRYGPGLEIATRSRMRVRAEFTPSEFKSYTLEYGHNADRFDHAETAFRLGIVLAL